MTRNLKIEIRENAKITIKKNQERNEGNKTTNSKNIGVENGIWKVLQKRNYGQPFEIQADKVRTLNLKIEGNEIVKKGV